MRRFALAPLAVLLVGAALAGCAGSNAGDDADSAHITIVGAPVWQPGDWWRYHVEHVNTGLAFDATIVVATVDDGVARVGLADGLHLDEAIITHVPMLGDVALGGLGWAVHERIFEPVRFPVEDGANWTTQWMTGGPLTATAAVTAANVTVAMTGDWTIEATYNASVGNLVQLHIEDYATAALVDHGYGFQGEVVVPDDLAFVQYPKQTGLIMREGEVAPPVDVMVLPDAVPARQLTFAMLAGTLPGTPSGNLPELGAYRVEVLAPDGTRWSLQGDGSERAFALQRHMAVPGPWTMTLLAAGPGVAAVEAFAFTPTTLEL